MPKPTKKTPQEITSLVSLINFVKSKDSVHRLELAKNVVAFNWLEDADGNKLKYKAGFNNINLLFELFKAPQSKITLATFLLNGLEQAKVEVEDKFEAQVEIILRSALIENMKFKPSHARAEYAKKELMNLKGYDEDGLDEDVKKLVEEAEKGSSNHSNLFSNGKNKHDDPTENKKEPKGNNKAPKANTEISKNRRKSI